MPQDGRRLETGVLFSHHPGASLRGVLVLRTGLGSASTCIISGSPLTFNFNSAVKMALMATDVISFSLIFFFVFHL